MTLARALRVTREPDDEANEAPTVAYGAELPSGTVVVEWDPEAFPEGERTRKATQSIYGNIADARQATGGSIQFEVDQEP